MKESLKSTGVPIEHAQDKGVGRFFEVLFGNIRDLIKLNLIFCCCVVPSAAAFVLGFFGVLTGYMYALAFLMAFPAGGAITSYFFCVTKMLRDEPGYIWFDFKRKFLENYKQAAAPGMLCAAFIYAQVFIWGPVVAGEAWIDIVWFIMGIVVVLIFAMVAPYIFIQIAYIDLKTSQILKNSVLVSFINAPRSFMGALTGGALWAVFVILMPDSLIATPLIVLVGTPVTLLLYLVWVWPPVDKQFNIDKTLRERREAGG